MEGKTQLSEEQQKFQEAFEMVERDKAHRAAAADKELGDFIRVLEEKYRVRIYIPMPEVPKIIINPL